MNPEMTPAEVAREFGVHASTVRRWEDRGILTPIRRLPGSRWRRYGREQVADLKKRMAADGTITAAA